MNPDLPQVAFLGNSKQCDVLCFNVQNLFTFSNDDESHITNCVTSDVCFGTCVVPTRNDENNGTVQVLLNFSLVSE